jgi:hypothetical protein
MNLSSAFGNDKPSNAGGLAAFDSAPTAPAYEPVPPGIYTARVVSGECCTTRAGTDAYRIRFEILEGPNQGRTVLRIWSFSESAISYAKRDLTAFGLTTTEQLLSTFPPASNEIRCCLVIALQRGDDGIERNDIKRIDVLEVRDAPGSEFLIDPSKNADAEEL